MGNLNILGVVKPCVIYFLWEGMPWTLPDMMAVDTLQLNSICIITNAH